MYIEISTMVSIGVVVLLAGYHIAVHFKQKAESEKDDLIEKEFEDLYGSNFEDPDKLKAHYEAIEKEKIKRDN